MLAALTSLALSQLKIAMAISYCKIMELFNTATIRRVTFQSLGSKQRTAMNWSRHRFSAWQWSLAI